MLTFTSKDSNEDKLQNNGSFNQNGTIESLQTMTISDLTCKDFPKSDTVIDRGSIVSPQSIIAFKNLDQIVISDVELPKRASELSEAQQYLECQVEHSDFKTFN